MKRIRAAILLTFSLAGHCLSSDAAELNPLAFPLGVKLLGEGEPSPDVYLLAPKALRLNSNYCYQGRHFFGKTFFGDQGTPEYPFQARCYDATFHVKRSGEDLPVGILAFNLEQSTDIPKSANGVAVTVVLDEFGARAHEIAKQRSFMTAESVTPTLTPRTSTLGSDSQIRPTSAHFAPRTARQTREGPVSPDAEIRKWGDTESQSEPPIETEDRTFRFTYRGNGAAFHLIHSTGTAAYYLHGHFHVESLKQIRLEDRYYWHYQEGRESNKGYEWAFGKHPYYLCDCCSYGYAVWFWSPKDKEWHMFGYLRRDAATHTH